MTRIGLTLDEHFDLRVKPRAGADPAFHEAAQDERDRMFPMATAAASSHLRSRGYDCRPAILDALVRQGVVQTSLSCKRSGRRANGTRNMKNGAGGS